MKVEKTQISKGSVNYKHAKRLTQISRRLSNRANFLLRKNFFTKRKIKQSDVDKLLKRGVLSDTDKDLYNRLPASISQRTIQIVGQNWSSFFEAIKKYKKNPDAFFGKPSIPKYKRKAKSLVIPCSAFKIKRGYIHFAKGILEPIKTHYPNQPYNPKAVDKRVREIRLVPTGSGFCLELIYQDNPDPVRLNKSNFLALDLGVDRFVAAISNQTGLRPFLINGCDLKRLNQWFNKRMAKLRSKKKYKHFASVCGKRHRQIQDKLHKISRYIVNYCFANDIGTVIVGVNKGWKQEISIGKRNNQNFVNLPHSRFVQILKYKLADIGINVIEQEEAYTSKSSFLDNDPLPKFELGVSHIFSGKRVSRSWYKSSNGTRLHADIHGAANIARKADHDGASLVVGGAVSTPILVGL